jgi:hypothetical protein
MKLGIKVEGHFADVEANSLVHALRAEPGLSAVLQPPVRMLPSEVDGTEIWVSAPVVVGLTSPRLISVLVDVVLAWARDPFHRQLEVSMTIGDETMVVRPSDIRNQVVERLTALTGDRRDAVGDDASADEVAGRAAGLGAVGPVSGNGDYVGYSFHGSLHTGSGVQFAVGDILGAGGVDRDSEDTEPADSSSLSVTIYLSDEGIHGQVEAAVGELLAVAGLRIEHRDDPVLGSWFRRLRAGVGQGLRSPGARKGALAAAHVVDTRIRLAQDAAVTATLLQNLGPVIASLQPTKDAVIRVGAVLIVKVDWSVAVYQLTAAQQFLLDTQPELAMAPGKIASALGAESVRVDEPPAIE